MQRFAAKLLYTRSRTADVMTIARAARRSSTGVGKGFTRRKVNAREEADSSEPVVVMGGTASERSSGHCARLWTSVGHWRDGKNLEGHTSDLGAHMAPLGVETAGRACYSINNTTFAMYSERDSLQSP